MMTGAKFIVPQIGKQCAIYSNQPPKIETNTSLQIPQVITLEPHSQSTTKGRESTREFP